MHKKIIDGGASVDPKQEFPCVGLRFPSLPSILVHGSQHIVDLKADALEHRPRYVPFVGEPSDSDANPSSVVPPPRREQPVERRHEVHAARILHQLCQILNLRGGVDDPHSVPQPLDRRAGDGDRAFQGVAGGRLGAKLVGDGGDEAVRRADDLVAGVEQDERAGPVGALGLAFPAQLAQHSGVLVAEAAGDGDPGEGPPVGDHADLLRIADDLGQDFDGDPQGVQGGAVPV